MELHATRPTAKAPAQAFTGDVYVTPIYSGKEPSRMTVAIVCPPGEEHWHGAAADTFMSHVALLEALPGGADPTTWLEPVPDQQYRAADQR